MVSEQSGDGIYLNNSALSVILTGNMLYLMDGYGIRLGGSTSDATAPKWCRSSGNVVVGAGKVGVFAESCNSCTFSDTVVDCSTASAGTYPAFKVSTLSTSYGGTGNVFDGCVVRDSDGTHHSYAITVADSGGAGTNVLTTRLVGCDFPVQATGCIAFPSGMTAAPYMLGGNLNGKRTRWVDATDNQQLTVADSGSVITNSGQGSTGIAILLPVITASPIGSKSVEYEFIRQDSGAITITSASDTIYNGGGSAGTYLMTSNVRRVTARAMGPAWFLMVGN
jgi:hypothetical protein